MTRWQREREREVVGCQARVQRLITFMLTVHKEENRKASAEAPDRCLIWTLCGKG